MEQPLVKLTPKELVIPADIERELWFRLWCPSMHVVLCLLCKRVKEHIHTSKFIERLQEYGTEEQKYQSAIPRSIPMFVAAKTFNLVDSNDVDMLYLSLYSTSIDTYEITDEPFTALNVWLCLLLTELDRFTDSILMDSYDMFNIQSWLFNSLSTEQICALFGKRNMATFSFVRINSAPADHVHILLGASNVIPSVASILALPLDVYKQLEDTFRKATLRAVSNTEIWEKLCVRLTQVVWDAFPSLRMELVTSVPYLDQLTFLIELATQKNTRDHTLCMSLLRRYSLLRNLAHLAIPTEEFLTKKQEDHIFGVLCTRTIDTSIDEIRIVLDVLKNKRAEEFQDDPDIPLVITGLSVYLQNIGLTRLIALGADTILLKRFPVTYYLAIDESHQLLNLCPTYLLRCMHQRLWNKNLIPEVFVRLLETYKNWKCPTRSAKDGVNSMHIRAEALFSHVEERILVAERTNCSPILVYWLIVYSRKLLAPTCVIKKFFALPKAILKHTLLYLNVGLDALAMLLSCNGTINSSGASFTTFAEAETVLACLDEVCEHNGKGERTKGPDTRIWLFILALARVSKPFAEGILSRIACKQCLRIVAAQLK
jgi:hypothetical protein